jgi:PPOX class probable F420-dependent enzyme
MDLPPLADLTDRARRFLEGPHVVVVGTTGRDGTPHQAVAWYRLDPDDRILLNSRAPRRWPDELKANPRCGLAVIDAADPMRWLGVQGVVESIVDDVAVAREDIVALAHRYDSADPSDIAMYRTQERISFRIRIISVHDHLED